MALLRKNWRILTSLMISLLIIVLAYVNRAWLLEAFEVAGDATHWWLVLAGLVILVSYLISAQVLALTLRSLGYRIGFLRTWATGLVAIIISQSVPAGGVGSYAFLVGVFSRRGVPPVEATLVASMESLSYVTAMLLVFGFSLIYLTFHGLATGSASYIAAIVALVLLGAAGFVLTRSRAQLEAWLHAMHSGTVSVFRLKLDSSWIEHLVSELVIARDLITSRRRDLVRLVLVQLIGLSGHALALLLVLVSLGATTSFAIVFTAFGIALITSTFNVLPGGGGTVETALVAVLLQLGVGASAVAAAIIFRLFNFWLLTPVAAACYYWLMHEPPAETPPLVRQRRARQRRSKLPAKPTTTPQASDPEHPA